MTDLTLAQRFGSNVSFDEASKTLTIDLNDLTDSGDIVDSLGLDVASITDSNKDEYATKILYSLLLLNSQQQPAVNNDETVMLYTSFQQKRVTTRNSVQQLEYRAYVSIYAPDTSGNQPDPDTVG